MTTETTETTDTTQTIRMTPRIALSIDRIAARASELGHAAVEAQCDRVLADMAAPSTVYEMIRDDVQYWPDRAIDRLLRDVGRSTSDLALEDYCEADARATVDALATVDAAVHARATGQQVFLVVCKNQYVDLGILIHLTRAGADATIARFQSCYGDRTWIEDTCMAPKWARYVRSAEDDGLFAYIKVIEVMK